MRFDPQRYPSATELRSPRVRWLHAYWDSKRKAGLPLRQDVDPVEMLGVLPKVMIIELVGARFRYRLVGTEVVADAGFDFTGKYLDEQEFANRDFYLACYGDVAQLGAPVFGLDHWAYPDGRSGIAEFGMMPLSFDGRAVAQILTIEDNLVEPLSKVPAT